MFEQKAIDVRTLYFEMRTSFKDSGITSFPLNSSDIAAILVEMYNSQCSVALSMAPSLESRTVPSPRGTKVERLVESRRVRRAELFGFTEENTLDALLDVTYSCS